MTIITCVERGIICDMPRMPLPKPEAVTETVEGVVALLEDGLALILGEIPAEYASAQRAAEGTLSLRYGVPFNAPGVEPIIPQMFVSERGVALVGREAWQFMQEHFQLYPRSELIGLDPAGNTEQTFLRALDFGAPVKVYFYLTPEASQAAGTLQKVILGLNAPPIPELLGRYLPVITPQSSD